MASWTTPRVLRVIYNPLDMPASNSAHFKRKVSCCALGIEPKRACKCTALGIYMLVELNALSGSTLFRRTPAGKLDLFYKSTAAPRFGGNWSAAFLRRAFVASWRSNVASFRSERAPVSDD